MLKRTVLLTAITTLMLASKSICAAADPFDIVPKGDEPITLVGTDGTGNTGVALIFQPDGPAAAFVCDGKDVCIWFTGSHKEEADKIELASDKGDTFSLDWSGKGALRCQAKIAGVSREFKLELATVGRLLRDVTTVDDERVVHGMIITNKGGVFGAGRTSRGKVAEKGKISKRSKKEEIDDGSAGESNVGGGAKTPGGGDAEAQRLRLGCKILEGRVRRALIRGDDQTARTLSNKAIAKGCTSKDNIFDVAPANSRGSLDD
jgi:hypothetical protein